VTEATKTRAKRLARKCATFLHVEFENFVSCKIMIVQTGFQRYQLIAIAILAIIINIVTDVHLSQSQNIAICKFGIKI
jgi:hypothetical protein